MAYRGKHTQGAGSEYRVRFGRTSDLCLANLSLEPLTSSFLGKLTAEVNDDDDDD